MTNYQTTTPESAKRRYFEIRDESGTELGHYTGETPKQAAYECFAKLVRTDRTINFLTLYVKDCTLGSYGKVYAYNASNISMISIEPPKYSEVTVPDGKKCVFTRNHKTT